MTRGERAQELFCQGYNCSQSVVLAFSDMLDMDESTLAKISSSFGGGLGRLREVCGSVSGMAMVAGLLYGYDSTSDNAKKSEHYARIQELAHEFEEHNGSIVCRELLNLQKKHDTPTPEARTESYYKKRPCPLIVKDAADILDDYIKRNPL